MREQTKKQQWALAIISTLVLIGIDQLTKYTAQVYLKGQQAVELIPRVFELAYVENRGAAFGVLQNRQWFFILMTGLIMLCLIVIYDKTPLNRHFIAFRISLVILFAGAAGNLFDRIRLGYVIDFFYFKLINFPVFNVADIYVTVIIFILAVLILFYYKEEDMDQVFHEVRKLWKKH